MELVCCMASHDSSVHHHLLPLALHPLVDRLWIIRHRKSGFGEIPKAEWALAPGPTKPLRLAQMLRHCVRLARRSEVKGLVSFNPLPYGAIALAAGKLTGKPAHLGFIGSDWNRHGKGRMSAILLRMFHKTDFITVPSAVMREEMVARGLISDKIRVMPHVLDLGHFSPIPANPAPRAFVYIGELIPLKRVDDILRAFANVLQRHPDIRLYIVGKGPLETNLRGLANALGAAGSVIFTGQVADVRPYLKGARALIIVSENEGFPFVIAEAICSGVIPIATPVGGIPEIVHNGENGLLCPIGDTQALAVHMLNVLDDEAAYARLREGVLRTREQFAMERATALWTPWLEMLQRGAGA